MVERVRDRWFKGKRLDVKPKIFQVSEMSAREHLYMTLVSHKMRCYRKAEPLMGELLEAKGQPPSTPESCPIHVGIIVVVRSQNCVWLFVTPWTAARQPLLSSTVSQSSLKFMSIELVMPSNRLILCHSLLLFPSIFPSIRVFSRPEGPGSIPGWGTKIPQAVVCPERKGKKDCGNPAASKSASTIFFPNSIAHFVCPDHILVTLTIFQKFSLILYLLRWSVIRGFCIRYCIYMGGGTMNCAHLTWQIW